MSEKTPEKDISTSTHDGSHPTVPDQDAQKVPETPEITPEKPMWSATASEAASMTMETSPAAPSVTPTSKQSWWARAKAALKDRSTQTLIIASLALGLSLIALMIALCDSRHDHKDSQRDWYHHSEMMERWVGWYRHSDAPRGSHGMMHDTWSIDGVFGDMWQRYQASIDSALSREMMRESQEARSYGITRSFLSEVNGKTSGTLIFEDKESRDIIARKLKRAGIDVRTHGEYKLTLESDQSLSSLQRLLAQP